MAEPFTTTRRVEFRDTDAAGIAHFSVFMAYMEQAEHEFLRSRGLSVIFHDAELGTLSWPRVAVRCDYQSAVRFEDVLTIAVSVSRLGTKSITYDFAFSCDGRAVAAGQITAVLCRMREEQPPESLPIPDWLAARLRGE